jgi:trimeric autotransporter adhesin
MRVRWAITAALAVLAIVLSSCSSTGPVINPNPSIGCVSGGIPTCGLFPTGITAGSQNFTLFISGEGFISTATGGAGNSVAYWNGSARPTFYNFNNDQLQVSIYASDVATAGSAQIQVINPAPGGGESNFVTFFIHAPQPNDPVLTSVSPTTTASGGAAFTLTVNGSNFANGYVVTWNGATKPTTFVSANQMTASISATDIASPGCAAVAVSTNSQNGPTFSVSMDVLVTGTGAPSNCTSGPSSSAANFPRVVSVTSHGYASNGASSSPAMSADGRFVAFYSNAKNLVSTAYGNIFVRDTCLGASAACKPRTLAVDLAPDGSAPNGTAGDQLALSADGRFVAFSSYATNLAVAFNAPSTTPISTIYVRDLCFGRNAPAGCTPHTEAVSVSSAGVLANNSSISPSLSSDGRFVAFASWATNLVPGTSASQLRVFVRDLCNGPTASTACVAQTLLVPQAKNDSGSSADTDHPSISPDGRYVAFQQWVSRAGTSNLDSVVFLRDMCLGIDALPSCSPSTVKISLASDGTAFTGVNESASVSADGRFVVFSSQPDAPSSSSALPQGIYLRDTCLGGTAPDGCSPTTTLIATAAPSGSPYSPLISLSGRYISFLVGAADSDSADSSDSGSSSGRDGIVYVYDTCFGATSVCTPQGRALTTSGVAGSAGLLAADKFTPVPLTTDGRLAAFYSATHIAAQPASGLGDVFQTVTSH